MRAHTRNIMAAGLLGLATISGGAAIANAASPVASAPHQGLADKLGVTQQQLDDAMKKAHDSNNQNREAALASALGVDEAKVKEAFDSMHADHQAAMRTDLESRIDAAITEGKLTTADKDSILKAFDAGVLAPQGLKDKGLERHGGPEGHRGGAGEHQGVGAGQDKTQG